MTERSVDRLAESDLGPELDLRSGSKHLAPSDCPCRFAVTRAHERASVRSLRGSHLVLQPSESEISNLGFPPEHDTEVLEARSRRGTSRTGQKPAHRGPSLGPLGPCRRRQPVLPGLGAATPFRTRAFGSLRVSPARHRSAVHRASRGAHPDETPEGMVPTLRWFHRSTLETGWRPRAIRATVACGCGQRRRPRAGEIRSSWNVPARPSLLQKSVVRVAALSKYSPLHGAIGACASGTGGG